MSSITLEMYHRCLELGTLIHRLQFHRVVRGGFAHPGGADADVSRLVAELPEVCRAEITHAGLDAADELRQHAIHRTARLLERLDAFGRNFLRRVRGMAITCRRAGFHRGEAAHAAILLVKFAADFDDVAGRFVATGKMPPQITACESVSAFTMSPDFTIPPSARMETFFFAAAREQT